MSESGEKDHTQPEHPENEKEEERALKANLEQPQETDNGEFQQDEPKAACEEEARELRFGAAILFVEESADTGGEGENRRAEMSDPAGKEEGGGGSGKIGRLEGHGGGAYKVTDVIERHDDHDEAAKSVDGLESRIGGPEEGNCGHGGIVQRIRQNRRNLSKWSPERGDDD